MFRIEAGVGSAISTLTSKFIKSVQYKYKLQGIIEQMKAKEQKNETNDEEEEV